MSNEYSMIPSELVPVFKNHAAMPMIGTGGSLKEIINNYKYTSPYECRVNSGTAPVDESDGYYMPEIGLPGNGWWFIKYFPFDASGRGSQFAMPLGSIQSPMYRVSTESGWCEWLTMYNGVRTKSFTISKSDWSSNTDVGDYTYRATISDPDMLESMDAQIMIQPSDLQAMKAAKIAPSGSTFDGGIYLYSKNIPSQSISGTYVIYNV